MVLHASTLNLVRVLAFGEIYPGTQHLKQSVSCIAVDSAMKVVRVPFYFPLNLARYNFIREVDSCFHEHAHCRMVIVRYSERYLESSLFSVTPTW